MQQLYRLSMTRKVTTKSLHVSVSTITMTTSFPLRRQKIHYHRPTAATVSWNVIYKTNDCHFDILQPRYLVPFDWLRDVQQCKCCMERTTTDLKKRTWSNVRVPMNGPR